MKLLQSITENLAQRIAAANQGIVYINQLIPFLPVSIELLENTLETIVDGSVVKKEIRDGLLTYIFTELENTTEQVFPRGICIYSGEDFPYQKGKILSDRISDLLNKELNLLAKNQAWPADAVWEHEILYITATVNRPLTLTEIAGSSRMPMKQVKEKLKILTQAGICKEDSSGSGTGYIFPDIGYTYDLFHAHDLFIRSFPVSLKEEQEIRVIKILTTLIFIVLGGFLLNFIVKIPFPIFLFALLASCGVTAIKMWFAKIKKTPEPIIQ